MSIRRRIIGRRQVKAGELKAHPLNWRTHPDGQRAAVTALYEEVGEVKSLTAYVADADKRAALDRVPPEIAADPELLAEALERAPLTLIDGHGRREWMPDELLEVEVLDLTDEEARKVLLSLDATAALAGRDDAALDSLRAITAADNAALQALWDSLGAKGEEGGTADVDDGPAEGVPEQYLVLVTCKSERHQAELLDKFHKQGLKCKALTS